MTFLAYCVHYMYTSAGPNEPEPWFGGAVASVAGIWDRQSLPEAPSRVGWCHWDVGLVARNGLRRLGQQDGAFVFSNSFFCCLNPVAPTVFWWLLFEAVFMMSLTHHEYAEFRWRTSRMTTLLICFTWRKTPSWRRRALTPASPTHRSRTSSTPSCVWSRSCWTASRAWQPLRCRAKRTASRPHWCSCMGTAWLAQRLAYSRATARFVSICGLPSPFLPHLSHLLPSSILVSSYFSQTIWPWFARLLFLSTPTFQVVDGQNYLGFDGKYILPNATPVLLHEAERTTP